MVVSFVYRLLAVWLLQIKACFQNMMQAYIRKMTQAV